MKTIICRPPTGFRLQRIQEFLAQNSVGWDAHIQVTVCLEENELVAVGSRQGNVLKCIAVANDRREEDLAAKLMTELVQDAFRQGIVHLFVYTKPIYVDVFRSFGFYPIATGSRSALLDNRKNGVRQYAASLYRWAGSGVQGAVVANCNPFTRGHLYLLETAAGLCDFLHVFILSSEGGDFSPDMRMKMAAENTAHIPNLHLHPTGDYLVSPATFPTYFYKDEASASEGNGELDLILFATHIAGALGISRRFVGSEPLCSVTAAYNRQMQRLLPAYGIEVVEIPRLQVNGQTISAGLVRRMLAQHRMDDVRDYVPPGTFAYLERVFRDAPG